MADSADSVRFAVGLDTSSVVAASEAAVNAGQRVRQSIDEEQAGLKELQRAYRNVAGGGKEFSKEQSELKDKIAAAKVNIAKQEQALLKMGFAGKAATQAITGAAQAEKKLESATKAASKATDSASNSTGKLKGFLTGNLGSMGSMVSKGGELVGMLGSAGVAGAAAIAAAAVYKLGKAAVDTATDFIKFGIAAADASRSEKLMLQGMAQMPTLFQRSKDSAEFLQGTINSVYDSVSIGRDRVSGFAQELYKSGLRGANLANALKAVSIAAAGGGDSAAEMAKGWVSGTLVGLGSTKKVLDRVNGLWGATVKDQMLSLSTQSERFHTSLNRLFTGINLDPILTGLKSVLDLFSTTTETGKALQFMMKVMFDPLAKAAGPTGLVVKRFFQGMVLAGLSFVITLLKIRNFLKDALGPVFAKLGISMGGATTALWLGKAAGAALIGTFVLLGAAVAAVAVPIAWLVGQAVAALSAVGVAIYGVIQGVGYLTDAFRDGYKWVKELDWGKLGTDLVNGIVNGITGGAKLVWDAIKNLGSGALKAFKLVLGIHSPSRAFKAEGLQLPAGAALGVRAGTPMLERSVVQMGASAAMSFSPDVPSISSISTSSTNITNNSRNSSHGPSVHIENINVGASSSGSSSGSAQELAHEIRLALVRELSFAGVNLGVV